MNMLCKTNFIEANQAISARKRLNAVWSPSFPLCPSICMQVTTMASCIELDLMLALWCMHLISLAFWIELNMIFTFFCMQVITMCSVMSWTLYSPSSACRWPPCRSGGIWSSTSSACRWPSCLSWTLPSSSCRWSTCFFKGSWTLSSPTSACR